MVGEYGQCRELAHVTVPLPLDPTVMLTGIVPEECSVFKSALSPLRLTFRTAGTSLFCRYSMLLHPCLDMLRHHSMHLHPCLGIVLEECSVFKPRPVAAAAHLLDRTWVPIMSPSQPAFFTYVLTSCRRLATC